MKNSTSTLRSSATLPRFSGGMTRRSSRTGGSVTTKIGSAMTMTQRGGRGLRGIGERVAVLRGTLDAGPRDGEWRVTATLPVVR